ncbi:hypothetical protein B0J18DRAFT_291407 [Chaetomium sp. MPI-SDFR-AT-0129]|nr:hypothetical protein B0J18DRAFT_291407 [Chaetomium sp. MPI-SDFR-AT-0129]
MTETNFTVFRARRIAQINKQQPPLHCQKPAPKQNNLSPRSVKRPHMQTQASPLLDWSMRHATWPSESPSQHLYWSRNRHAADKHALVAWCPVPNSGSNAVEELDLACGRPHRPGFGCGLLEFVSATTMVRGKGARTNCVAVRRVLNLTDVLAEALTRSCQTSGLSRPSSGSEDNISDHFHIHHSSSSQTPVLHPSLNYHPHLT